MSKKELKAVKLIDDFRDRWGENRLRISPELNKRASGWARTMHAQGRISHDGYRHRLRGWLVGWENVYYIWPAAASRAWLTITWWKNSRDHRFNMLEPTATHIGLGEFKGYWCAILAERK